MSSAPAAQGRTDPRFLVIDMEKIGFLPDVDAYGSMGMNSCGEVVYGMVVDSYLHAWIFLPHTNYGLDPGAYDLSTYTETEHLGIARDINSAGFIVGQEGSGNLSGGGGTAGYWTITDSVVEFNSLGTLSATNPWSGAISINDQVPPLVVGASGKDGDCTCPNPDVENEFDYDIILGFKVTIDDPQPSLDELRPPGEYSNSCYANGVNTPSGSLLITGISLCAAAAPCSYGVSECDPDTQAAKLTYPGSFLDDFSVYSGSSARRMSDNDHVAGWGKNEPDDCDRMALYWPSPTASKQNLGAYMPGGQEGHRCRAEGVNNLTLPQVVGWDTDDGAAILWEKLYNGDWAATNLNDAINCSDHWLLVQAHAINDDGWIAVIAQDISGAATGYHALLLVPYQECVGDVTCDGQVGIDELLLVLNNWGPCPSPPDPCPGDFTDFGTVGIDDLLYVVNHWGPCSINIESSCEPYGAQNSALNPNAQIELLLQMLQQIPNVPQEIIDEVEALINQ